MPPQRPRVSRRLQRVKMNNVNTTPSRSTRRTRPTASVSNRPASLALFGMAGALQFSIAAAQILLARRARLLAGAARRPARALRGAALLLAAGRLRRRDARLGGALARSAHQPDRLQAARAVPARAARLPLRDRRSRAHTLLTVVVSRARAVSAAFGIVQYGILHYDNLGQRPQGTLGHYMTYSGLLMLVIGVALARVALRQQRPDLGGARACRRSASRSR